MRKTGKRVHERKVAALQNARNTVKALYRSFYDDRFSGYHSLFHICQLLIVLKRNE